MNVKVEYYKLYMLKVDVQLFYVQLLDANL